MRNVLVGLVIVAALVRCSDGSGSDPGVGLVKRGDIKLEPDQTAFQFEIGQAPKPGDTLKQTIRMINVGQGDLTIAGIDLAYTPPAAGDPAGAAFAITEGGATIIAPGAESRLTVQYMRQGAFAGRTAVVTVRSDSIDNVEKIIALTFSEKETAAAAQVSPSVLDFGVVQKNKIGTKKVSITSTGTEPLVCDAFVLKGSPDFAIKVGDKLYPVSEETQSKVKFPEPIEIAVQGKYELEVTFSPLTIEPQAGELALYCNDPKGSAEGWYITLIGNNGVPCIQIDPVTVDFGGKKIGTKSILPVQICNCGDATLKLKSIHLDPQKTSTDFALDLGDIPQLPPPELGIDPNAPFALGVNQCTEVHVTFVPDVLNDLDADNKPIPDEGILVVENNSFEETIEVPLIGYGAETACPVAVIEIVEGEQVIPQTTLHLKGDQSYAQGGLSIPADGYEWTVTGPEGSPELTFIPGKNFANPVVDVNVAGIYTFCLTVRDEENVYSCEDACWTVVVIPKEAIHIELIWDTPLDPDTSDTGETHGSDMDLHFAHPFANSGQDIDGDGVNDPWFDQVFDCFWFNKTNNWGSFSPEADDDPSLDRDDTDGWGPENLNVNIPEEGATYSVGVHYWNPWGFCESTATLRIYIYGTLDVEIKGVPMKALDMWNAAKIPWTAGTAKTQVLKDATGAYLITPDYQNPFMLSTEVNACSVPGGGS